MADILKSKPINVEMSMARPVTAEFARTTVAATWRRERFNPAWSGGTLRLGQPRSVNGPQPTAQTYTLCPPISVFSVIYAVKSSGINTKKTGLFSLPGLCI